MEAETKPIMAGAKPIYIERGSKVGVLMLHGFTSTPCQFKELCQYLSGRGITVYAPLIAGHGTCPDDLIKTSPDDWVKSVRDAYFKLRQKAERVVLIGNSFGSNLAFRLARELNNEPSGIITLGAPIFLKYDKFIRWRFRMYGRFKKYYHKPRRVYKADYTDMVDDVTYPVIPIKNLGEFLDFIKKETIPNLPNITAPILIGQATVDPVVGSNSADYIYQHIGSLKKEIYRFNSRRHVATNDSRNCQELFCKIHSFIREVV